MTRSKYIVALLAIALTLPVYAGGGGGGGRGGRGGGGGGFGGGGGGFGGGGAGGFGGGGNPGGFGGAGGRNNGNNNNVGGFQTNQNGRGGRGNNFNTFNTSLTAGTGNFSILDSSSIFSRDRRAIGIDEVVTPVVTQPVIVDKGSIPVFRASIKDDHGYSAMLETMQNGAVTVFNVQEGGTIPWNGAKVLEITADSMTISTPSVGDTAGKSLTVAIGNNVENQETQASSVGGVGYVSADVLNPNPQYNNNNNNGNNNGNGNGRGGRGGRGGGGGGFGGGGGGFGGGGGGFGGGGGGFGGGGGGFGGGGGGIGITGGGTINSATLVNPSLDPPLPAGSADSLEARMAARRAAQVGN